MPGSKTLDDRANGESNSALEAEFTAAEHEHEAAMQVYSP